MLVEPATLTEWLTRLRLTAIRDQLDNLLDEAARQDLSLREITRRNERRIDMAGKIAHFP